MSKPIVYEYQEVLATSKFDLQQAAKDGFEIYGVSRDLRADHSSYVKLRRPLGKEGKK